MSSTVFLAVIFAAMLHALWNALVKGVGDTHLSMIALQLGSLPIALGALLFVPMPSVESWPFLAAAVLLHFGYNMFLLISYRVGDFTQVYPIARGSAPLLVAGVSVLFLDVHLQLAEIVAILLIGAGILSIGLVRHSGGERNVYAALLALVTGCFIAAYSLVDGFGVRLAGTAVGFYCWVSIINSILFTTYTRVRKPGLISAIPTRARHVFFIGGNATFVAFSIVLWAFTQEPIVLVTALRETSIVFAMLLGVFVLKEKLNLVKVCSTTATLFGAALLRLST